MSIYNNPNVRSILIVGLLNSIASSILWFTPTWLIYSMGGDNEDLGFILGIATFISVFSALIGSIIADRYRQDMVIWIGSIGVLIGIYILSTSHNLSQVLIGQLLASGSVTFAAGAIGSLFANSIPSLDRNRIFGTQFLLNTLAGSLGNIIGYFLFLGSETEIENLDADLLRFSLQIAAGFQALGSSLVFFIKDHKSIDAIEEGTVASKYELNYDEFTNENNVIQKAKQKFAPGSLFILSVIMVCGFIISFGAGISVPYLPRFFFDIYKLDLSELNLAFAGLTIVTAIWGKINANLADKYGRVELIVTNQVLAVLLLYVLALYPPLVFALAALFIRNAVMNGAWPLGNAISMEYTPRMYRAKLTAIGSIGWSAMFGIGQILGGIMVERVDFYLPFIITATLYLIATVLYWTIRSKIQSIEERFQT